MKKNITSNSFLHLLALSLVFSIAFSMITGCNITDSKIQKESYTVPPIIKHAQTGRVSNDEYLATSSFLVGDAVNFVISIKGPSKNIIKIHLTEYYPADVNQARTEFKPLPAVIRKNRDQASADVKKVLDESLLAHWQRLTRKAVPGKTGKRPD